jgi:inhibitor of KinA
MVTKTKYLLSGDRGLIIEFENKISEKIGTQVRSMMIAINLSDIKGIVEMIPSYRSLLVIYNPIVIDIIKLQNEIKYLEKTIEHINIPKPHVVEVPVLYSREVGIDIENVAKHNRLSVQNVIDIHSSKEYYIYMLGFTFGFPYLGKVENSITVPKYKKVRNNISSGSIGIGGVQTGIYTVDSPSTWQIIGKTPLKLFDPNRNPIIILNQGDYVKFKPITEIEYKKIEEKVEKRTYEYKIYSK